MDMENRLRVAGYGLLLAFSVCSVVQSAYAQTEIYRQGFSSQAEFNTMTVVDVNQDGITWVWDSNQNGAKISYNNDSQQDDWLITPALNLEKGHKYHFSFAVTGGGFWAKESYSASVGTAATAEGMTTELIARTTMEDKESKAVKSAEFYATESGTYYFGIHCTSDMGQSTFRVDDIVVEQLAGTTPAAPQLSVVVQGQGGLSAQLTAVAPTKTIDGEELTSLTKLTFYRDGVVLKTVEDPVPGESYKCPDALPYARMNEYKCVATNAAGDGDAAIVNQWVGTDTPGAISNLRYTEDLEKPGLLILSWDVPKEGEHGGYFDDGTVKYWISAGEEADSCVGDQPTCSYDLKALTSQKSCTFGVWASNSAGSNRSMWKLITCVGGPSVVAPLTESFSKVIGPWTTEITRGGLGDAHWYNQTTPEFGGSQDGDGYCNAFAADFENRACRLKSPKIDISQLVSPKLSFFTYMAGAKDTLRVQVNPEFTGWETLRTIIVDQGTGWTRVEVDLSDYQDYAFVQVGFEASNVTVMKSCVGVDQVSVRSDLQKDMEAVSITVPEKVKVDEKAQFCVVVRNNGSLKVEKQQCRVELLKGGNVVDSSWNFEVEPGMMQTIVLMDTPTFSDGRTVVYTARVVLFGDQYEVNDECGRTSVNVLQPQYPKPQNLTATPTDSNVYLTWDFDATAGVFAEAETEGFEDYTTFDIGALGSWAQYDGDGALTVKMAMIVGDDVVVLEYDNAGAAMAFQVFDPEEAGIPYSSWDSHGGSKYIAAFRNSTDKTSGIIPKNDDWIISPLLCGNQQTISFFAKATTKDCIPEMLEVWYTESVYLRSEEDMQTFKKIDTFEVDNVSGWKEFLFDVPTGAAHFAIRYCSQGKYAVLVDDISYVSYNAEQPTVEFNCYNIYRDDELIGFTTQPFFIDDEADVEEYHKYNVTATFELNGVLAESAYSNDASIASAIEAAEQQGAGSREQGAGSREQGTGEAYDLAGHKVQLGQLGQLDQLDQLAPLAPSGLYILNGKKIFVK